MGRKFSGHRPEDQPIFTNPRNQDFEKRRIFFIEGYSHPSARMKVHGNEYHDPDFAAIGDMYFDAGLVTAEVPTNNTRVFFDLGGVT